jgi:hypothetical protein
MPSSWKRRATGHRSSGHGAAAAKLPGRRGAGRGGRGVRGAVAEAGVAAKDQGQLSGAAGVRRVCVCPARHGACGVCSGTRSECAGRAGGARAGEKERGSAAAQSLQRATHPLFAWPWSVAHESCRARMRSAQHGAVEAKRAKNINESPGDKRPLHYSYNAHTPDVLGDGPHWQPPRRNHQQSASRAVVEKCQHCASHRTEPKSGRKPRVRCVPRASIATTRLSVLRCSRWCVAETTTATTAPAVAQPAGAMSPHPHERV